MNTQQTQTTPAALAPYEHAARIYCTLNGVNPDQVVRTPHPIIKGISVEQPLWHEAADRLLDLSRMLTAMKQAKERVQ
jgi:hypothetical protein